MTMTKQGLVYVFTGEGKGKTSAALGIVLRSVCAGLKVAWISWYKSEVWDISEKKVPQLLPVDFYLLGKGFYIIDKKSAKTRSMDTFSQTEHQQAALAAYDQALKLAKSQIYDVIVLDEVNNALADSLLTLEKVLALIKVREKTHLVLTGRNAPSQLIKIADLVTTMKKTKHPFDQGKKAVKGLDF